MLNCIDRQGHNHGIKVGDTCRFPLSLYDFGRYTEYSDKLRGIYDCTWDVVAFCGKGLEHCAIVQRRQDRKTKVVALHWIALYSNPYLRGGCCHPKAAIMTRAREKRMNKNKK